MVGPKLQVLTVSTVVCIFALITLGGVVRLTNSGLGCPDWPLCHGQLFPPIEYHALIEYSHRTLAALVGVLVAAQAFIVWRWHRDRRWFLTFSLLGVVLVLVQGALGGVTVLTELPGGLVLAHLATAEALIACMVLASALALSTPRNAQHSDAGRAPLVGLRRITLLTTGMTYVLLITGSYVTVSGASASCGVSWPLCDGSFIPEGHHASVHMAHRLVTLLVSALVAVVLVRAWRQGREWDHLRWTAIALAGLLVLQVGLGAAVVTGGFTAELRATHLSMGTLMWVSLVVLAIIVMMGRPRELKGNGHA